MSKYHKRIIMRSIKQNHMFPITKIGYCMRWALLISFLTILPFVAAAAPGDIDPTFGPRGKVTTSFEGFTRDSIFDIAPQTDGKIVVVGVRDNNSTKDSVIARYNPDGALDISFDNDGFVILSLGTSSDEGALAVAIQTDGKILVAGYTVFSTTAYDFAIIRLNTDGSLDSSFGNEGKVFTDFGNNSSDTASAIVIQPDGKFIVVGDTRITFYDFAVARYNTDGSLDTSFGTGGKVTTRVTSQDDVAKDVAIQPDGKIVVAGSSSPANFNFTVIRYNTDGSLDTSFDGDGFTITPIRVSTDSCNSVVIQQDGKIVAAGSSRSNTDEDIALVRYNANGSLDTSFDGDGKLITNLGPLNDVIYELLLQPDGKLVAVGVSGSPTWDFILVRYNQDGSLDNSFGNSGKVIDHVESNSGAYSATVLPNGKFLAAGTTSTPGSFFDFAIAKYNSDGTTDTSFGPIGLVSTSTDFYTDDARAVVVQPDGKIVIGGSSRNGNLDFTLVRYNPDGSLDSTFGILGIGFVITRVSTSLNDGIYALALQPDGKILAAGYVGNSPNENTAIVRYNSNGTVDSGFHGGSVIISIGSDSDLANDIAVQPDGKILIGGYGTGPFSQTTDFMLFRLTSNGNADTTFGLNGFVSSTIGNGTDIVNSLALQADGKIVASGWSSNNSTSDFSLARYNTDGTLDLSFGNGGKILTPIGSGNEEAKSVAIQTDGKIVVGGLTDSNSAQDFALVRYNPNGSLDTTFDGDGIVTTSLGDSTADNARKLLIQPNGKIIANGISLDVNSSNSNLALVRYNNNGSLDSTFGTNGKVITDLGRAGESVLASALQTDGKIVVAGGMNRGLKHEFLVVRYLGEKKSVFDYDGDGRTDISIYRPSLGQWWLNRSIDGNTNAFQFGDASDKPVPADYDGDGKTDVAVFRPSTGFWYVLRSSNGTFFGAPFGNSSDKPAPADFDGDGLADFTVFRPSSVTWFINKTSGGVQITTFGAINDIPTVADYDGDGKADISVFRPNQATGNGEWWMIRSTAGNFATVFGLPSDKPVQGDYTGDGKADVAFWRPTTGEWFVLRSEDNSFYAAPFGASGDIPAPGDYDGDGKFDFAVFRPSQATWFILRSTQGTVIQGFGANGDIPTPSSYIP